MTAIDWRLYPEPWCQIGPRFTAEVKRICSGGMPLQPHQMILVRAPLGTPLIEQFRDRIRERSLSTVAAAKEIGVSRYRVADWRVITRRLTPEMANKLRAWLDLQC